MRLDAILIFQHRAIHRLANAYFQLVSEAIGTSHWDYIVSPALQTQHVLELLRQNVHNDSRFLDVLFYPIRPSINASPKYYLLFASRHYDAFQRWNDELATEETTFTRRTYDAVVGQTSVLPEFDDEIGAINLLNEVRGSLYSRECFTKKGIVIELGRSRWGRYHTGDIKKTVRSMLASDELNRANSLGKKIDEDYMSLG